MRFCVSVSRLAYVQALRDEDIPYFNCYLFKNTLSSGNLLQKQFIFVVLYVKSTAFFVNLFGVFFLTF